MLAVHQAALLDRLALDAFPFEQNRLTSTEIDVGGREIVQALVVAPMIVVADEGLNLTLEVAGQVVVFQQDAVLQRLVPVLDLALGLRMTRRAANMIHGVLGEPLDQLASDVTRPVVGQQAWPMPHPPLSQPEAVRASCSVSVTSLAAIVVHSFQAMT